MIVYFDTNIFIRGKYHLSAGKFNAINNLISSEQIKVIYTSATIGEIEKNLVQDLSNEVDSFNRFLKKGIPIIAKEDFNLSELKKEPIINEMKRKINSFFTQKGVFEIPLGQIEADELMKLYFSKQPPFEDQKPYEFKDAIMISAIKKYSLDTNKTIIIVSDDKGFISAFKDSNKFITFNDLESFLKYANTNIIDANFLQKAIDDAITEGKVDKVLEDYIQSLYVFCDTYEDSECIEPVITLESAYSSYINVINKCENNSKMEKYYTVLADISTSIIVKSTLSYRDEEMSYYDKEEERYLFEYRKNEERIDSTFLDLSLQFEITITNEEAIIEKISTVQTKPKPYIEINDFTLVYCNHLKKANDGDSKIIRCSQCDAVIGSIASYYTYENEPLCSNCMKDDSYGFICPNCGLKYPNSSMINGFCERCENERNH